MSENTHLVPICIIYADGVRLNTTCEGALRSVVVIDTLNAISECNIIFDYHAPDNELINNFNAGAELSVHLGYKDDTQEVFNGEITGMGASLPEYGDSTFRITASSRLHRLERGTKSRVIENKTPSKALQDIISLYNLQAETDPFGPQIAHWQQENITDFDLLVGLAKRYGKDVYCFGNKVYVKELMTHKKDEIIYEWGKSLSHFSSKKNTRWQISGAQVFGWDNMKAQGFAGKKAASEVKQKVGGGKDWTKLSRDWEGKWTHNVYDDGVGDIKQAEEAALAILRDRSFKLFRAEGAGEGNAKLSAGILVTVKYVGEFSGEYIADYVVHRFSLETGYTTEFCLKRNMVEKGFEKSSGGTGAGSANTDTKKADQAKDEKNAYGNSREKTEEEEDENAPEFRGLKWKKDGKDASEALVDDEVTLVCEVKNIEDGESVKLTIYEHDDDEEHDHIKDLNGKVKNGKVQISWKAEYHADNDDSNCAEEIEKLGYTVPEYFFIAEYNGVKSEKSKLLYCKGWVNLKIEPYLRELLEGYNFVISAGNHKCNLTIDDKEELQINLPIAKEWKVEVKNNG